MIRFGLYATGSRIPLGITFRFRQGSPVTRTVWLGYPVPRFRGKTNSDVVSYGRSSREPCSARFSIVRLGDRSPRDRSLTKLKKENGAARSRAERRYTRGWRGLGRVGPFCERWPETNSRKICLLECEEGNKTKRVSRVSARRERRDVCMCTRVDASTNPEIFVASPHHSLSFSRTHSPARVTHTEILDELSERNPAAAGRLTFHASITSLEKKTETPRGPQRGPAPTSRRFSCCDRYRTNAGERSRLRSRGKRKGRESGARHLRAWNSRNSFMSFMSRWTRVTRLGVFVFETNTREETWYTSFFEC